MRRLGYPHHLQPVAALFCSPAFILVGLTFAGTLILSLLRINGQLPQCLRPLFVGVDTCEVIRISVAYQHACGRLAYEILERALVCRSAECGEKPARAEGIRY